MPNIEVEQVVHVAVALIQNSDGQVLLSKRAANAHQGNLWEFPGGKINIGESVFDALVREIQEELGLEIKSAIPVMRIPHNYSDKRVLLDVWQVESYKGEPDGMEEQPIQWCAINDLFKLEFPEANLNIVNMLKLPSIYGITPNAIDDVDSFLPKLDAALKRGVSLIQVRQPKMSKDELESFTKQVLKICSQYSDVQIMLNTDIEHAKQTGVNGVHLSSGQLKALPEKQISAEMLISASCHNEAELKKAELIGADFVVLSPAKYTKSHPDTIPLGWEKFKELATTCNLPVYALGGMSEDDIDDARAAGAVGVSILSGLWG